MNKSDLPYTYTTISQKTSRWVSKLNEKYKLRYENISTLTFENKIMAGICYIVPVTYFTWLLELWLGVSLTYT